MDEATDKLIDALAGIDEEIAYTMQVLYNEKTETSYQQEACTEYTDMWNARNSLLDLGSNRGSLQKETCDSLTASRK